jgi:polyhydroxybutyrate depolymerase
MDRTYLAYIPSGDLSAPALIIALHGSMGTGKKMREICGDQFERLAEKEKFIVVYPDGYQTYWNDCRTEPKDDAHTKNIDDVGFITKLIEACCTKWHADPKKVYAVGLSNGGHMCFRLATEIRDKIAGIAVIGASMPGNGYSKCAAPRAGMPVMIVNGTDDPINPFEGGMVRLFYVFPKGEVMSSMESARAWLKPEDREQHPKIELMPDRDPTDETHIERLSWPGSKVCLLMIHGGGHTVPGGSQYLPEFVVGRVSRDMNMAHEAWSFFNETR